MVATNPVGSQTEPILASRVCYGNQQRVRQMFFFFSNGIGCLGSIIISIILSLVVMAVLGFF